MRIVPWEDVAWARGIVGLSYCDAELTALIVYLAPSRHMATRAINGLACAEVKTAMDLAKK